MRVLIFLAILTLVLSGIYQPYYQQAYQIAVAMSLDQKIGQCLQVDFGAFSHKNKTDQNAAIKLHLGSLLVGGDGMPNNDGDMIDIPEKEDQDRQVYSTATINKWQKLAQKFNYTITITTSDNKKYDIRPLLGTDAVHGNQHVSGTILFPHNSGLACSHNPNNFYNAGKWTASGVKLSGFNYAFSPTVAVSHNPQWGRFYQTMGQQSEDIYAYAKAYTEGLQGKSSNLTGILGSVKHFYADGATLFGADEGNAIVGSYKSFIKHNTQGYNGSIAANVGSVMVSYSSINWIPNAIGPAIQTILRQKLQFDGFVISDYDEMQRIINQKMPTNFNIMNASWDSVSTIFNAGMDMIMIPGYRGTGAISDVISGFKNALKNKTITEDRLNDAVARIISVKLALGAANQVTSEGKQLQLTREQAPIVQKLTLNPEEYSDSLTAVHQSLVLLKNQNNVIPFNKDLIKYIVLVGERVININGLARNELFRSFDDIGMQNGGWTLRWQGFEGNSQWQGDNLKSTNASSILTGLKNINPNFNLLYPNYTSFTEQIRVDLERRQYLTHLKQIRKDMTASNTIILGVLGQMPFAEFKGDVGIPYCSGSLLFSAGCMYNNADNAYTPQTQRATLNLDYEKFDKEVITNIHEHDKNIPLVTVLVSGRPMLVQNAVGNSSAVISAWLPGTSGGDGIANALTGRYRFRPGGSSDRRNTLAFDWPKTHDSLKEFPIYEATGEFPRVADPLFTVGHGLSTSTSSLYPSSSSQKYETQ